MPTGDFDKRVSIQSVSGSRDAHGQVAQTWATAVKRWASIVDTSGNELRRAQQVNAEVSAVITLREQYDALTSKHRIVFGSRTFNIESVIGGSDRTPQRGQVLACREAA